MKNEFLSSVPALESITPRCSRFIEWAGGCSLLWSRHCLGHFSNHLEVKNRCAENCFKIVQLGTAEAGRVKHRTKWAIITEVSWWIHEVHCVIFIYFSICLKISLIKQFQVNSKNSDNPKQQFFFNLSGITSEKLFK